jgi:hypothetical protein
MANATSYDYYSTLRYVWQAWTRIARNNFMTKHKLKIYVRDEK